MIYLKTWQKATFIIVLILFIATSVTISFLSMAQAPFEYEYQTEIADTPGNEGWVLFGFNGNTSTKEVYIDYVRDEDGNNPDKSKPVSAVGDFTMNTDEYVEVIGDISEPYASTKRFYEYVTNEPQIKAVLAGHLHFDFECRLPNGAMQFVTNRGDRGNIREITII